MRASNSAKDRAPTTMAAARRIAGSPAMRLLVWAGIGSALLVAGSFGCAPSSPPADPAQGTSATETEVRPEITDDVISERINDVRVREVPEADGAGEPISWGFYEEEPKEIAIVDKQSDGNRATIILDIKTMSGPRAREPRYLAGQIRTEWELRTGWVLRRWEIVRTENISMKYKNLPKPPPQNSNR